MSPAATNVVVVARLTMSRPGASAVSMVRLTGADTVVPLVADAILVTPPASMSAWVTV